MLEKVPATVYFITLRVLMTHFSDQIFWRETTTTPLWSLIHPVMSSKPSPRVKIRTHRVISKRDIRAGNSIWPEKESFWIIWTIPGTMLAKDHGNANISLKIHSQNDSVTKTNRKIKDVVRRFLAWLIFCCCFDNQNIRWDDLFRVQLYLVRVILYMGPVSVSLVQVCKIMEIGG